MACINMFNDHQPGGFCGAPPLPISPRISFSNDFAVEPPPPRKPMPPVDPDFEFAVGGRPMIAADELFFKGRMLPLRDTSVPTPAARATTLRDQLRDGADEWTRPPPKVSPRWKEFLGFRRSYKGDGSSSAAAGEEYPAAAGKFAPVVKREVKGNGGSTDQDLEMLRY
ncbi:hypothetical protein KSP39_PZI003082 [Platanthera zijinensis]|uniref:Uncharacterized protein n=1 Tax=Platanthera zijinensis TaxID=2320716 RepID=A0AAP0GDH7_9ASPA